MEQELSSEQALLKARSKDLIESIAETVERTGRYSICFPCRRIYDKEQQQIIVQSLVNRGGITAVRMGEETYRFQKNK